MYTRRLVYMESEISALKDPIDLDGGKQVCCWLKMREARWLAKNPRCSFPLFLYDLKPPPTYSQESAKKDPNPLHAETLEHTRNLGNGNSTENVVYLLYPQSVCWWCVRVSAFCFWHIVFPRSPIVIRNKLRESCKVFRAKMFSRQTNARNSVQTFSQPQPKSSIMCCVVCSICWS